MRARRAKIHLSVQTSLKDFKTGWLGLSLGIKQSELPSLISALQRLSEDPSGHFHARSHFKAEKGLADMEFYLLPENAEDDMTLDFSPPISPDRSA